MSQAEKQLREILNVLVKEKFPHAYGFNTKSISSGGANNTSCLFEVTIISEESIDIFAKVASMGSLQAVAKTLFDKEKYFYSKLANIYEEIQGKCGIKERLTIPKNYRNSATEEVLVILIENLASKGYECYDRLKCVDWRYASKSVEELAKFHALSFALRKKYPEEFNKAEVALTSQTLTDSAWDGLTDGAMAALDKPDREILSCLLEGSRGWSIVKDFGDPINTRVIIHRDYRVSNLMHKEVNGELHVIPIDYQTVRVGCPVADLIYFIVLSTDQQFRQKHYHQLVDHYYQQLELALARLGLVPEEEYGRQEFESDMKEKLPLGLCLAAVMLPFVTVDAAHAPTYERGRFVPRPNELFVQRFRGLFADFKQWGFIPLAISENVVHNI